MEDDSLNGPYSPLEDMCDTQEINQENEQSSFGSGSGGEHSKHTMASSDNKSAPSTSTPSHKSKVKS